MASWPRSTASTSRSTSTATGRRVTDAEREAAWAEYYGDDVPPPDADDVATADDVPAADDVAAPVIE